MPNKLMSIQAQEYESCTKHTENDYAIDFAQLLHANFYCRYGKSGSSIYIPGGGLPPNGGKWVLQGGRLSESRMTLISRKVTDSHGVGDKVLLRNHSPVPRHHCLPIPYPCSSVPSVSSVIQTARAKAGLGVQNLSLIHI